MKRLLAYLRLSFGLAILALNGFYLPTIFASPLSAPSVEDVAITSTAPPVLNQEIGQEIEELMASSPSPADLPEDAVIFLLKEEKDEVNLDGTAQLQFHDLVKVLKEPGKALSQIRLPYNQLKEEIEIVLARTIKPDGRIVNIDPALVQDMAPLGNVPIFSDLRIRQFVLPDVSVGDFLELKYIIRIKEPTVKGVFVTYFTYPLGKMTLRSRLSISLPAGMKYRYAVTLPNQKEPVITRQGDKKIFQWSFDPVVLSHGHEPAIPPSFDVDPFIFFSTMESWQQLTEWYVPYFEENLKKGHDVVQAKFEQLTLGIEEREKIIKTLTKYVAQEIEYVGISLGDSGWKPYPPDYVLNNRYADCKGKASLLIAMLRLAGIDAYGSLIKPSNLGRLIKEVPSLDFTHMIVAIPKTEGGYLFVDPTLPLASYDYLSPFEENRDIIILDNVVPHFEKTPIFPIESSNFSHSVQNIKVAADGSGEMEDITRDVGFRALNIRANLRNINPALIRDFLEESIRRQYPQSQLLSYDISDIRNVDEPLTSHVKSKIYGLAQSAGNMLMMDQMKALSPDLVSLVTYDQRVYPLFLGFGEMTSLEGTAVMPEGYSAKFIPADLLIEKTFGSYERHYEFAEGKLTGKVKFVTNLSVIPLELYPEFKDFIEKIGNAEKEKIVFEKEAVPLPTS